MAIFPVADPSTPLFDTIMSVAMSGSAAWMSWLYLCGEGAIALAFDAPLFLFGPFPTPAGDYFADIGFTYAMIPVIAGFIGLALRR